MKHLIAFAAACLLLSFGPRNAHAGKVRDLCDVVGARDNQLVGYGVVTGLNGTGDDVSAPFAAQSLRALLRRLGVQIDQRQVRLRNVAAVIVTTNIPAFVRQGGKLDVTVTSIGNARSLRGGVLIQTPLRGADRRTYAVGQGALIVGGFSASGGGSSIQENSTNTARVPGGALVEREIRTDVTIKGKITLSLRTPDFTTADRVSQAINKALGQGSAKALDAGAVEVKASGSAVALLAKVNDLDVDLPSSAKIVINERTGTIVAGGDIRLSPVAIAQGGITISVTETPVVSQPGPLSQGTTQVVKETDVQANEQRPPTLSYVKGATTLADVARSLSVLGVAPRELASLLQALKAAGALHGEIIVQ